MQFWLYDHGNNSQQTLEVDAEPINVGRNEDCGVQIPDASVSKEHMKIEYKLGTFISTDLQSKNGIVINGRQLRRASLAGGDVIQLGGAILRFDC